MKHKAGNIGVLINLASIYVHSYSIKSQCYGYQACSDFRIKTIANPKQVTLKKWLLLIDSYSFLIYSLLYTSRG